MIIETIIAIAALSALACLTLSRIKSWLRSRSAATRIGDLVKRDLRDGKVEIVAIGLTESGTQTGEKTWTAKSLDSELAAAFGYSNYARITI
jgi:hypothetical protein